MTQDPGAPGGELAGQVIAMLRAAGHTVAAAESLTGGLVAAALTSVPGASEAVRGGVVSYATDLKATLLGVDQAMLDAHGAVYPGVAAAMANGVRRRLGATFGVATTGVAGPDPADGQPVGTVHIAVSAHDDTVVRTLALDGDRDRIRRLTVERSLALLLGRLREDTRLSPGRHPVITALRQKRKGPLRTPGLTIGTGTVEGNGSASGRSATMVLLRHLLGDVLRRLRLRQGRTLREVSASARVSLGYLSEVERGQKEASSELLSAICSALGIPLSQVFREVADNFALAELQNEPVLGAPREPKLPAGEGVTIGAVRTASFSTDDLTSGPAGEFGDVDSHVHEVTDMVPV